MSVSDCDSAEPEIESLASGSTGEDFLSSIVIRSSVVVDLNRFRLRISSNVSGFSGYEYFAKYVPDRANPACTYELICIDLDRDPIDLDQVLPLVDRTYRAERFQVGYYLAHHFGPPAHLVTRGNRHYVFGRGLERTVWPYFIKHLLTVYAADHSMVHLKAAGFVQEAGATLLFGKGSAGKTVFLTQACLSGARFLANTHVLVRDSQVYGIPSAMRVRSDPWFAPLVAAGQLQQHFEKGEYRADPNQLFENGWQLEAPVRNVCIVDFDEDRPSHVTELDTESFCLFLDNFALAIGTYGLKDDLLAHVEGDLKRYLATHRAMRESMVQLVESCRRLHVNVDMLDPVARADVLAMLGESTGEAAR